MYEEQIKQILIDIIENKTNMEQLYFYYNNNYYQVQEIYFTNEGIEVYNCDHDINMELSFNDIIFVKTKE